jgi:hypothetical protein
VTKSELLDLTRSERKALDNVFEKLTEDELCAPVLDGGRSMKDVLAHVVDWERRIMRATTAAERGEDVAWPEPGFEMSQEGTDRLNERDFLASRERPLTDVLAASRSSFADYLAWIEQYSDEQIASEPPYTPGLKREALIRGNGYEHYRVHLDEIEAWWAGQGA